MALKYRVFASAIFSPVVFTGILLTSTSYLEAGNNNIMRVAGLTSQPIGHYEYCQKNVADCSIKALIQKPTILTRERWKQMVEANSYANSVIEPVLDIDLHGKEEVWELPVSQGDCEDYVLLKRKWLMLQGWPASSLLVTVVRQPNGEGHAVLTVRTNRGDFILDNLRDKIKSWNDTEYTYLKRVSPHHSGMWEDILDSKTAVGSVSAAK